MKKLISFCLAALGAVIFCPNRSQAVAGGQLIYDSYMPIPAAAAYNSTFSVRADGIDWASAQIVVTSVTQPAQTFTDGQAATATITVVSFAGLSTATASGQFTAVSTQAAVGVAGTASVGFGNNTAGAQVTITGPPGALNYIIGGTVSVGVVSSNTASNFATAVNLSSTTSGVTATQTGTSANVTLACVNAGVFCNLYAVTSSSPAEVSTAAFSGGTNPVTVTLGGANFTAGSQFQVGTSTAAMAANLAAAITTLTPTILVATASVSCPGCGVVFATTTLASAAANYAMASSNPLAISTSSAFMTGGQSNAVLVVNGQTLTANKDYFPITSNNVTGTAIANAFNLTAGSLTVTLGNTGAVIGATATVIGTAPNAYVLTSSTNAALSVSVLVSSQTLGPSIGTFSGGLNSAYLINTSTITFSSANTFGPGEGVFLSTASNITIAPLAGNSTFYVITSAALGPNAIELATTQANALANVPIVLTSSANKTTADTFTLTVPPIAGTPSVQWMASNDNLHWLAYGLTPFNITIPSVSYGSYFSTGTVTNFDFGHYNYSYLGLAVTAPTSGAINIGAHVVGNAP